jgi:hypothetical protein
MWSYAVEQFIISDGCKDLSILKVFLLMPKTAVQFPFLWTATVYVVGKQLTRFIHYMLEIHQQIIEKYITATKFIVRWYKFIISKGKKYFIIVKNITDTTIKFLACNV